MVNGMSSQQLPGNVGLPLMETVHSYSLCRAEWTGLAWPDQHRPMLNQRQDVGHGLGKDTEWDESEGRRQTLPKHQEMHPQLWKNSTLIITCLVQGIKIASS